VIPDTPGMRLAWLMALGPQPVYDEEGNVVDEAPGILSKEELLRLLMLGSEDPS
jgi:hypothetical protein